MTLASGAHVKIGSYEFMLDETVDNQPTGGGSIFRPHYKHTISQVYEDRAPLIVGNPDLNEVRPERLLWSMTDWSGGEGQRNYQPADPYVYDFGYGSNPRIRGQITGRPNRVTTSITVDTNDGQYRPCLTVGNSAVWLGLGTSLQYATSDTTNWTNKTDGLTAGETITAMAGDGEYVYYSGWKTSAGTDYRDLNAATTSANGTAVVTAASAANKAPYAGLATCNGRLYAWTGRRLFEHDVFQSFPLGSDYIRKVGDSGIDPVNSNVFGTKWWANCVSAETSIFCFYTTDAQSTVYEFQIDGGFGPVWNAPYGFSIKSMKYVNGVLFMGGHWGGDSNLQGYGCLYAMPLDTRRPVFVGWFRKQNSKNLEMQEMCVGYGNTILIAAGRSGRIFVYDADMDSISNLDMLDTVTGGSAQTEANANSVTDTGPLVNKTDGLTFNSNTQRVGDMITFGTKRIVATYKPGSNVSAIDLITYDDDEPPQRQAGTSTGDAVTMWETGDYDFGMPFDQKILHGFHVLFAPLTTGQGFLLEYQLDGGAWTAVPALSGTSYTFTRLSTSSTAVTADVGIADHAKGRTFVQVSTGSSTVLFSRIRFRMFMVGKYITSTGYKPPIIYNVTLEASMPSYDETWELLLRIKDEQSGTRPSSRKLKGHAIRDYLWTAAQNKQVVTFFDGYYYPKPVLNAGTSGYKTNTCIIDEVEDIIIRNGEGTVKIKLRAVPS